MSPIRHLLAFNAVLVCLAITGCGSSSSTSGVVTLDDAPLAGGGVTLFSTGSGAERVHAGAINEQGAFTIQENQDTPILPGEYIVVVNKPPAEMGGESVVPKIYRDKKTSPLRVTIDAANQPVPPIKLKSSG